MTQNYILYSEMSQESQSNALSVYRGMLVSFSGAESNGLVVMDCLPV